MKFRSIVFAGVLGAAFLAGSAAGATTITFDDLSGDQGPIPLGYNGLTWDNFYYLNAPNYVNNPSGYLNGMISSPNVAFNGYGDPAGLTSLAPFTLNSGYFTGAWSNGLIIKVTGRLSGVTTHAATFKVDVNSPTLKTFNWTDIDEVLFVSSGGSGGSPFNGTQFALDDLTINEAVPPVLPVPEPSSLPIFLAGVAAMGAALHLARKKAMAH